MHPDWLEAFVAVAEHLSFAEASRILHRAQPTVHVQVQKLADHLRVTLYRRVGRGIELTEEGQRVAAFARETLAHSRAFEASLAGHDERRPVVLAAGEGAFLYLLGPAIRRFRRTAAVPLQLVVGDADEARAMVLDARADIAVTTSTPDERLQSAVLAESGLWVAMPKRHPLAARRSLSFAELADVDWVAPAVGRPLRSTLEQQARLAGFSLKVVVEAHGWPLQLHFVALGVGLAVVNDICRLPPGVVGRRLRGLAGPRYWAVRRDDAAPRAEVVALWRAVSAAS